jgi:hypothetical protein
MAHACTFFLHLWAHQLKTRVNKLKFGLGQVEVSFLVSNTHMEHRTTQVYSICVLSSYICVPTSECLANYFRM